MEFECIRTSLLQLPRYLASKYQYLAGHLERSLPLLFERSWSKKMILQLPSEIALVNPAELPLKDGSHHQ